MKVNFALSSKLALCLGAGGIQAYLSLTSIHEDVPMDEIMYLVFALIPGESYRRRLRSLLFYLCYVFRALINSLLC